MPAERIAPHEVGPVLLVGRIAEAIVAAIRRENAGARISPHGSYVRVCVPHRCEVAARTIAEVLGAEFQLPQDLERVMPSFRGRLRLTAETAAWEAGPAAQSPEQSPKDDR